MSLTAEPIAGAGTAIARRYEDLVQEWARQQALLESLRAGLGDGPGDEADQASIRAQFNEQAAVASALRAQLDELTAAAERAIADCYGLCERCQRPIPAERLAIFPAATHCVTCKQSSSCW